jgi:hypothetical protein
MVYVYIYITETHSKILTGEGIATFTKNHYRHWDRSPTDALLGVSHLQRIPWAAALTTIPLPPALRHLTSMYSLWGLSLILQIRENRTCCTQDILSSSYRMAFSWSWTLICEIILMHENACPHATHRVQNNWMPRCVRWSHILQTDWIYHHVVFIYLDS